MRKPRLVGTPRRRHGRHRAGLAACAAAAITALAGCGSTSGVQSGDAIWPGPGIGNGLSTVKIGEPIYLGLEPLRTHPGNHPVRLLRATVLGVPDGMVIDHVWGERFSGGGGTGLGGARGFDLPTRERPYLHDVSEVTLDPMCGPAAKCITHPSPAPPDQDWYLAIQAHLTHPGSFGWTKGVRLVYEVDGQQYEQTLNDKIWLSTGGPGTKAPPI